MKFRAVLILLFAVTVANAGNIREPVSVKTGPFVLFEMDDVSYPDLKEGEIIHRYGFKSRWGSIHPDFSNMKFVRKNSKGLRLGDGTISFTTLKKCTLIMVVSSSWHKSNEKYLEEKKRSKKKKKKKKKKKNGDSIFDKTDKLVSDFDKKLKKKDFRDGEEEFLAEKEFCKQGWKHMGKLYQTNTFEWNVYRKKFKKNQVYSCRTDKKRAPVLLVDKDYGTWYKSKFVRFTKNRRLIKDQDALFWTEIPTLVLGGKFSQHTEESKKSATVHIKLRKDEKIYLAAVFRKKMFRKDKGVWKKELMSKKKLVKDDWIELENVKMSSSDGSEWILFERECKKDEEFSYRTDKYLAPFIILGGKMPALTGLEKMSDAKLIDGSISGGSGHFKGPGLTGNNGNLDIMTATTGQYKPKSNKSTKSGSEASGASGPGTIH